MRSSSLKLSSVSYMLSLDSVIGNLVSARILENVLHISAVEVEELLISSIDL